MTNIEFANDLRLLADFYEREPEMPIFNPHIYCTKDEFLRGISKIKKLGRVTKDMGKPDSNAYSQVTASVTIGAGTAFTLYTPKSNICRLVQRWECPDSLLEKALNSAGEGE